MARTKKPTKPHVPPFSKMLATFKKQAIIAARKHALEFAGQEKKAFVRRIEQQKFKSFKEIPLNPEYKEHKIAKELDERTMISTEHYKNSIRVFYERHGTREIVRIGFSKGALAHKEDGTPAKITLNTLAEIQEHGTANGNVPPRPHWGPHLQDMAKRAVALKRRVVREVTALFRKTVAGGRIR